jgi:hypothetical protein
MQTNEYQEGTYRAENTSPAGWNYALLEAVAKVVVGRFSETPSLSHLVASDTDALQIGREGLLQPVLGVRNM